MAEAVSAATGLVTTSLALFDRVYGFYEKHAKVEDDVTSFKSDMRYIEEAIRKRSQTADRDGIRSWIDDIRRIKQRIEDAAEFYDLKVAGHTGSCEGALAKPLHTVKNMLTGPKAELVRYLREIEQLVKHARNNVDLYLPELLSQLQQPQVVQTTSGGDENYDHHPKVADPVGLEAPTTELVQMLSDATLRVVAICGPDGSRNSVLAEEAYNQVKEEFQCKAYVTAYHDGEKKLLQDILDQLDATHQVSQDLIQLRRILRTFLTKKRYIIGINGLETTEYWNDLGYAFPDDHMSSRIIFTTTKEEIAQACRKNCTLRSLKAPKAELVQMLSDATLLRVVTISGPDGSRNSVLAEESYSKVQEKEDFQCKAWVTQSHDDEDELLKDILDQLDLAHQESQNLTDLRKILRDFLVKKRYIIGINGLETTQYWNGLRYAFPDNHMSSRIIVTTTKEEIAQACRKNSTLYSLQAPKVDILQMLSRDETRQLRVVSICGRGGCGKSILAGLAYKKVMGEFQYKAWSRKSQNSMELLRDILDKLGAPQTESNDAIELGDELRKFLTGKKYIIVIDGLETDGYWRDVRYACPDDKTSSRIIVTTTTKKIASICSNNRSVYMMQQALDKSSAQDLLVKEVYGKDGCSNKLREDLTIILEICEYLPLAISDIGNYMRGEGLNIEWNYEKCQKLSIKFGSLLVNKKEKSFRGTRHVLNRSYTSLNDNAKACLMSLGSYPNDLVINDHVIEDHVIKVKPLIRRLLAERLISSADDLANECLTPSDDLVNHCLTPLIEHSFIVPTEYSISGRVKTFRVNRMLPQFIKEKGDHENYVTRIDIQQGREVKSQSDITRLYLRNNISSESSGIGEKVDLTRVRLLTFHGEASQALMDFNSYTFLRVLILENCRNLKDDKIDTVCSPSMLKYLSIRGNKYVSKLPDNIAEMQLLETLDIRDTKVHELTMKVILLPKLIHLFGKFKIACTEKDLQFFSQNIATDFKLFSGKTWQLQTLAGFFVYESPYFAKLLPHMLKLMSKVKIICRQTAPMNSCSNEKIVPNEKVESDIIYSLNGCFKCESSQSSLRSLTFDFGVCDLDFLKSISVVPSSLLSLKLCGRLTILPEWITLCSSLTELVLWGSNIGRLSELQSLENLLSLKLTYESTKGSSDFQEECIWYNGWFKSLTRLHLDFPKLPKIVIKEEAMKNLHSLQLSCTELGGFDGIKNLRHLEELIFDSDTTSEEAYNFLNQVKLLPGRPRILGSGSDRQKFGTYKRFPKPRRAL